MFIGNQEIFEYFNQAALQKTLNQAYGFVGVAQLGKRTLAETIAATLLGQERAKLNLHPDFYSIERLADEKTGKIKKDITVGQAREIKAKLQNRSWLSGYQVVIIDEAECFNEESANSLLKLLEEPGQKNVFFLLSEDESKIIPTVHSRCQWWHFNTVPKVEIEKVLRDRDVEGGLAHEVAELSWGRPGRAITLAENPEKLLQTREEVSRYKKLRTAPIYERFKIIENLAGEKKSAAQGKDELDDILQIWTTVEAENIMSGQLAARARSAQVIDRLARLRGYLRQNIHPRLALEEFCLSF